MRYDAVVISDEDLDRMVRKVLKSEEPAEDLRRLACRTLRVLADLREETKGTRVRHLRAVADEALEEERWLFPVDR